MKRLKNFLLRHANTPNIDLYRRHLDLNRWRFVVYLSASVVALEFWILITRIIEDNALGAALSATVVVLYGVSLNYQLNRHPKTNRFWIITKVGPLWDIGGPYLWDRGVEIFDVVTKKADTLEYDGDIDVFMVQSENKEAALEEARRTLSNEA